MTLEEVAGELYGLAPAEFVAARDERVRRARDEGDRPLATAIGKLRRPTVAAWAVNLLAREASDEVGALLALGDAMRDAQRRLSGDTLRTLTTQRQQVVNALSRKSGELAAAQGHPLSEAVLREVGQTLHAALADPEVADQVRTGTLTAATSYEGFGPAALTAVPNRRKTGPSAEATADEKTAPAQSSEDDRRTRTTKARSGSKKADKPDPDAEARRELSEALEALESARAAYDSAQSELDRTAADLSAVEERITRLRDDLANAESERRFTVAANRTAKEAHTKARRHLDHVERWAEKTRDRLSPS
ncbi:hypothetical protein [Nocardia sp. NPDC050406]|uniref:hypothetical protein n=1 Tax=Nocardia sp. NPDC050406 TaxID=3364318 RepID=UPI0037AB9742